MSNSFDKYDNKHTCIRSSWRASLPFAVFPQRPTKEGYRSDFEPDTMSSFQKTPVSHWRVNAYSALSFDRIYCYVLLFSWANKNSLFWRLLNDCQIARPVLVSSPPNWKKPYNRHLISLVFFLVRTVNYGSSFFFHRFMAQARNRWKKTRSVIYSGIKPLWDEAAFPKLIIFLKI